MEKVKHTPGLWSVGYTDKNGQVVVCGEHMEIATCWHHSVGAIEKEMHANARRIVACVNACAGIETDVLEAFNGTVPAVLEFYKLTNQRDELLAALEKLTDYAERNGAHVLGFRSIIAKATGETK